MKRSHISLGKMMTASGLKWKTKVFAFFYEDAMTFKLGKDYAIEDHEIADFAFLSPFKTKPPMKAWYIISAKYMDKWESLTNIAYRKIKQTA